MEKEVELCAVLVDKMGEEGVWGKGSTEGKQGSVRKQLQEDEEAEIGLTRAHVCGALERERELSVFMCTEAHLIFSRT